MSLRLQHFPLLPSGGRLRFSDTFRAPRRHSQLEHQAIDIGADRGTPVVSTTAGVVVSTWTTKKTRERRTGCGWTEAGGYIVIIVDDQGFAHYYAHLNREPEVSAGDRVTPGQRLGEVGNTGTIADGGPPHLHYQVWRVGPRRDSERVSGIFVRPFGAAINPYQELLRLAR